MTNISFFTHCFTCARDIPPSLTANLCEHCLRNHQLTQTCGNVTRDQLLEVLSHHIGADNGVSATELARECQALHPLTDLAPLRFLRTLVEELRLEGHHICATPDRGYYMASNTEELTQTCRFLLARAMSSLKQIGAMKRVSLPDLEGQLNLRI